LSKEELALEKEKLGGVARTRMHRERVSSEVFRYFEALAADRRLPALNDQETVEMRKVREWPEVAAWVEYGYGVEFSQMRPPHPSIAATANGTPMNWLDDDTINRAPATNIPSPPIPGYGSWSGPVHVKGYVNKYGTYVQPYTRGLPDGNPFNNKRK
jgi:hypothetical protein